MTGMNQVGVYTILFYFFRYVFPLCILFLLTKFETNSIFLSLAWTTSHLHPRAIATPTATSYLAVPSHKGFFCLFFKGALAATSINMPDQGLVGWFILQLFLKRERGGLYNRLNKWVSWEYLLILILNFCIIKYVVVQLNNTKLLWLTASNAYYCNNLWLKLIVDTYFLEPLEYFWYINA